jgi:hypothetical protein
VISDAGGTRERTIGGGGKTYPYPETIVTIATNVMDELADDDDNSKGLRV